MASGPASHQQWLSRGDKTSFRCLHLFPVSITRRKIFLVLKGLLLFTRLLSTQNPSYCASSMRCSAGVMARKAPIPSRSNVGRSLVSPSGWVDPNPQGAGTPVERQTLTLFWPLATTQRVLRFRTISVVSFLNWPAIECASTSQRMSEYYL